MINIRIVCVGNIKEKFYTDAVKEYEKRLSSFCKLEIIELKEYKLLKENAEEISKAKEFEAKEILPQLKGYTVALEIKGKNYSSTEFANFIQNKSIEGNSKITFIIGGSHGLDASVSSLCKEKLSFSAFTFPHQLMRVILLEQVYRAFTILTNKSYHK